METMELVATNDESAQAIALNLNLAEADLISRIAMILETSHDKRSERRELNRFAYTMDLMGLREFNERTRLARLYCLDLAFDTNELAEIGIGKLKILRKYVKDLNRSNGVDCGRRLATSAKHYNIDDLQSRLTIARMVDDATHNRPPQHVDNDSQEIVHSVWADLVTQIQKGPPSRFPSPPTNFIVSVEVWRNLTLSVQLETSALLVGPAGCGKTDLVSYLAAGTKRPLFRFSFGAMSEPRLSLIGSMHFDVKQGTFFSESRFVRAIKTPKAIVLLDELNRADHDCLNLLLPLLDGQRILSLDECADSPQVQVAESVSFVATANVGREFTAANTLDQAIRDRFGTVVQMDYPSEQQEIRLLVKRNPGLKTEDATWLTRIAKRQREMAAEGEFTFSVSTRMLLEAAKKIVFGIVPDEAVTYSLTNHFSREGGDHSDYTRFRQLLQRYKKT